MWEYYKNHPSLKTLLRDVSFLGGIALVLAFISLCRAFMQDWRWIFGFPVLFGGVYLFIKLWAWVEGIDRDGLTPEERAQRDREGDDWQ